jgi:hypothetical protein
LIGSEGYIQTSPYTESFAVPTALERTVTSPKKL